MTANAASLRVRISADLADIKQGLSLLRGELAQAKRAAEQARPDLSGWQNGLSAVRKAVGGVVAAFAALQGAQVVFQQIKQAIDAADRLDELSARLQVSTEKLSAWGYAAQMSGTSLDALAGALPKLSRAIVAAQDEGSRMREIFDALGIKAIDPLTGRLRKAEEVLPELADAFAGLDNPTLEAALAMELFGKSGAELLEFLNRGSRGLNELEERARALGIVVSAETAGAAAEFNDRLADLRAVTQGLVTQLSAELLPELNRFLEWAVEFTRDGSNVSQVVAVLSDSLRVLAFLAEQAFARLDGLGDIAAGVATQFTALVESAQALARADWVGVQKALELRDYGVGEVREGAGQLLTGQFADDRAGPRPSVRLITADSGGIDERDRRMGAVEQQLRQQVGSLEAQLQKLLGSKGGGGKSDAERKAEQLRKELERLDKQIEQSLERLRQDEIRREEELQEQLDEASRELLRATGRETEAAFADIDARWKDLLERMRNNGNVAGVAIVESLIDTQKLQVRLDEFRTKLQSVTGLLQSTEGSVSAQMDAGTLGRAEGEDRIAAARESALRQLQALRGETQAYLATLDPNSPAYAAALQTLNGIDQNIAEITESADTLKQQLQDVAIDGLTQLFTDIATGSKSAGEALRDFAETFVRAMIQIAARAVAMAIVLKTLDAIVPGFSQFFSLMSGVTRHTGGLVGTGGEIRSGLSPLLFGAAPRYHRGGIAGLAPGEVPAILEAGEEVLTRDDPRHRLNGGGAGGGVVVQPEVSVQVHNYSGEKVSDPEVTMEQGRILVKLAVGEVNRGLATRGSPTHKAMMAGLGRGASHG